MTLDTVLSVFAAAGPAYLLGAIPFGLVLGKAFRGVDIREHGSRNLGATNALRVLGPRLGALTVALDFGKGLAPVLLAPAGAPALAAGIAAIVGHVFPIYLRFRGGKGVATAAGVFAGLAPLPAAAAIATFAATVALTRYVSLGSILAALALPPAVAVLAPGASLADRAPLLAAALAVSAVVLVRHRGNVSRLRAGTEPRLGAAGSPPSGPPHKVGP